MPMGNLYIISAPSGAGKTSLVKALLERTTGVVVSVSHTTRPPRPGERDGIDYHFIDKAGFESLIQAGQFLEYAQVFDNYYGTSRAGVFEQLQTGQDVILEIDWQGARQAGGAVAEAIKVFILPPSRQALLERLTARGQDSQAVIERRMRDAISEMSHFEEYEYLLFNDEFERAVGELQALFIAQRLRRVQQQQWHADDLRGLLEQQG